MTISALRSASVSRWVSRRNCWFSSATGSRLDLGPRFCGANAWRTPASRSRRHVVNREEYKPSRRSSAPTPPEPLAWPASVNSGLKVAFPTVNVNVRNSGTRAGAEVAQLYLQPPPSPVDRPVKELKGFERVMLQPGETKTVTFTLDKAAMSYYDPAVHDWVAQPGRFTVLVGSSSRDIRAKGDFELA